MIKTTLLAAALGLGLAGTASAATIFTENFDGEVARTNASLTRWDVTGGSIDVIPVGTQFIWYPDNGQYVDLNGSTRVAGRIETKSGLGLILGNQYSLTFNYGNNKNSNGVEQLTFGFGDQTWVIDISGEIEDFLTWTERFIFNGSSDKLFFADTGNTPGDNGGPIIDNITVAAVPLPAGGLLLIGALGGLAALRRRKARAA